MQLAGGVRPRRARAVCLDPQAQSCASWPGAAGRAAPRTRHVAVLVYLVTGLVTFGRTLDTSCRLATKVSAPHCSSERVPPAATSSSADGFAWQAADLAQREANEALIAASDGDTSIVIYIYRDDVLPKHVLEARSLCRTCLPHTDRPDASPEHSLRARTTSACLFPYKPARTHRASNASPPSRAACSRGGTA